MRGKIVKNYQKNFVLRGNWGKGRAIGKLENKGLEVVDRFEI